MGINFTSDIDGATSGSGITKITVGGKTINLSETGGNAGNGVVGGTFTPAEKQESFSIDTGIDFSFIVLYKKTTTLGYGYRTFCGLVWDVRQKMYMSIATNASGGAFSGMMKQAKSDTCTDSLTDGSPAYEGKNGTYLILNRADSVGWLSPEEYQWYAW